MSSVVIFGGSGFIGSNIAKQFLNQSNHKIIIASRNPLIFKNIKNDNVMHEHCDITNDDYIINIFKKYKPSYCVNCVSLWKETESLSFESIHKFPVKRIVNECNKYGTSLAYISGLGLHKKQYKTKFLKIRYEAEQIVINNHKNNRASFIFQPGAIIDDSYPLKGILTALIPLLYNTNKFIPIPLFGNGENKLSLISINDLSKLVMTQLISINKLNECKIIQCGNTSNDITYNDLINRIYRNIHNIDDCNLQRATLNVPIWFWWNLARIIEKSKVLQTTIPLERAQVELMENNLIANIHDEFKTFNYEDCFQLIQNAVNIYTQHKA